MKFLFVALAATLASANQPTVEEQNFVNKINSKTNLWRAEANGQDMKAFRRLLGVHQGKSYDAVQKLPRATSKIADDAIPDSFDSATNWPQCAPVINDIRDQSMCGCCWAFAGAEAASDRLCISTNGTVAVPLSAQDVCFGASFDGCDGGQIDTPWQYIARSGAVTGGQYKQTYPVNNQTGLCSDFTLPHCHHHGPQGNDPYPPEGSAGCPSQSSPPAPHKCDPTASGDHVDWAKDKWSFEGMVQSASGEEGIQKAIMEGGPVETAFTVYSDFANYVSGIYHHVSGGVEGGHAVRIVGWGVDSGTKYWKVANSWNPYWGENGYFRIKRGNSECGIEDGVTFSGPNAKWSQGK
jgi:cathepsin B